jgi:hypothetical protein
MAIKGIDQFGEIQQGSAQSVDFVANHNVDQAVLDVCQQPLQGRAVEGTTRHAAVVIPACQLDPAL